MSGIIRFDPKVLLTDGTHEFYTVDVSFFFLQTGKFDYDTPFTPVWLTMCIFRELGRPQYEPQTSHLCRFLPGWVSTDLCSKDGRGANSVELDAMCGDDVIGELVCSLSGRLDGPAPRSNCWRG